jgi:hypothetical protein
MKFSRLELDGLLEKSVTVSLNVGTRFITLSCKEISSGV